MDRLGLGLGHTGRRAITSAPNRVNPAERPRHTQETSVDDPNRPDLPPPPYFLLYPAAGPIIPLEEELPPPYFDFVEEPPGYPNPTHEQLQQEALCLERFLSTLNTLVSSPNYSFYRHVIGFLNLGIQITINSAAFALKQCSPTEFGAAMGTVIGTTTSVYGLALYLKKRGVISPENFHRIVSFLNFFSTLGTLALTILLTTGHLCDSKNETPTDGPTTYTSESSTTEAPVSTSTHTFLPTQTQTLTQTPTTTSTPCPPFFHQDFSLSSCNFPTPLSAIIQSFGPPEHFQITLPSIFQNTSCIATSVESSFFTATGNQSFCLIPNLNSVPKYGTNVLGILGITDFAALSIRPNISYFITDNFYPSFATGRIRSLCMNSTAVSLTLTAPHAEISYRRLYPEYTQLFGWVENNGFNPYTPEKTEQAFLFNVTTPFNCSP